MSALLPWQAHVLTLQDDVQDAWWREAGALTARMPEADRAGYRLRAEATAYRSVCDAAGLIAQPWLEPTARPARIAEPADVAPPALRPAPSVGRRVVDPKTCGGCGCPSVADAGSGSCFRCGWSRASAAAAAAAREAT